MIHFGPQMVSIWCLSRFQIIRIWIDSNVKVWCVIGSINSVSLLFLTQKYFGPHNPCLENILGKMQLAHSVATYRTSRHGTYKPAVCNENSIAFSFPNTNLDPVSERSCPACVGGTEHKHNSFHISQFTDTDSTGESSIEALFMMEPWFWDPYWWG